MTDEYHEFIGIQVDDLEDVSAVLGVVSGSLEHEADKVSQNKLRALLIAQQRLEQVIDELKVSESRYR